MMDTPWKQTKLRVNQLVVGPPNRPISDARCRKMLADWDPMGVGTLYVNHRTEGTFHVIDGGHRHFCLVARGEGSTQVDVMLAEGLTYEEENAAADILNDSRKANSVQRLLWKAGKGAPGPNHILSVLAEFGYTLSTSTRRRCVRCAVALDEVDQLGTLRDTFAIIEEAWGDIRGSHDDPIIRGIGHFLHDFSLADRARLARKLTEQYPNPQVLIQMAALGGTYSSKHRRVPALVLEAYNHGLKTRRLAYTPGKERLDSNAS